MNTLVAKEFRQIRPALMAALLLAALPVWLCTSDWQSNYHINDLWNVTATLFFFGWLLLALTSFGREFGMGTFPVLLALPVTRQRIWWTKILVLAGAMAITLLVVAGSTSLWYRLNFDHVNWGQPESNRPINAVFTIMLAFVVIVTSGLWTTLLFRQMLAACWFAVLIPLLVTWLIAWKHDTWLALTVGLGAYSVTGFLLAQRSFYRAQEVAWTGGEVSLPELRAGAARSATRRAYRPLAALIAKELHMYKLPLAGMAGFFLLHLAAILLRRSLLNSDENGMLAGSLAIFGGLWILVPLMTAGIAVADERRMGTMEGQLCLPVSQRTQFLVKLAGALLITGVLSALLLWTGERIGLRAVGRSGFLGADTSWQMTVLIFTVYAFVVFYTSTLARNNLQVIVLTLSFGAVFGILQVLIRSVHGYGEIRFWMSPLFSLLLCSLLLITAVWLAYANFCRLSETRRLWLRNLRALGVTVVFATVMMALIYNRTWEYLTPLEPAHGPAKFTLASVQSLNFRNGSPGVSVLLSDGRMWSSRLGYESSKEIKPFGSNLPVFVGAGRWLTAPTHKLDNGSNWLAQANDYFDRAAIRSDGTLWVSEKPTHYSKTENGHLVADKPAPLVRLGAETDWKDVAQSGLGPLVLLKRDGTLWLWIAHHEKNDEKGLAAVQPKRLETDSDWTRIVESPGGALLWKQNEKAWRLNYVNKASPNPKNTFAPEYVTERASTLDDVKFRSLAASQPYWLSVREDGTLWKRTRPPSSYSNHGEDMVNAPDTQVGTETNWVSVASDYRRFVALKSDGTLWQWRTTSQTWPPLSPFEQPPVRLGTHNDWVALGGMHSGACALAADGSLWLWTPENPNYLWMRESRRPAELANIFSP